MTKEEYLKATSYASVEEAKKDLSFIRVLFPLTIGIFITHKFIATLAWSIHPNLGLLILIGYLAYIVFFIWKCRDVIKKTRQVSKAQLFFSIILAPISWIWFYPQLSEPLEIIVGSRMSPTTDALAEGRARIEARRKGARNAIRTILITVGVVFLFMMIFGLISWL